MLLALELAPAIPRADLCSLVSYIPLANGCARKKVGSLVRTIWLTGQGELSDLLSDLHFELADLHSYCA